MSKPYINFFMAFDSNYTVGSVVAMTSIIKNLNPRYTARFFLVEDSLPHEDIEKIDAVKDIISCDIIHIQASKYKDLLKDIQMSKVGNEYFRIVIYHSLLIFKVLPDDVDKCFYIDSDLIINTDLSVLYEQMPSDKAMVAVVEFIREQYKDAEDLAYVEKEFPRSWKNFQEYPYFNAGFFLLNTDRVRALGIDDEIFHTLKKHANFPYLDQDILNLVFGQNHREEMLYLHPKYNVFCFKHYKHVEWKNSIFYKDEDVTHAINYPLIFHFGGAEKPWKIHGEDMVHYDIWWYYCRMSPYHDLLEPSLVEPKASKIMQDKTKYYLFNFIPILKKKVNENKTRYYLFGLIPLLKKKVNENKTRYYLFGLIPLLKKKVNENKTRYYLFGFIPLIKIKNSY